MLICDPTDRAIINKQIQIHFTPGSDEIMPGSFFVLDSLGETMTSFGNTYLRGDNEAWFEEHSGRTKLIQEFRVHGLLPRIMARIFATGSYKGSFQGELNDFAKLAEREAGTIDSAAGQTPST